tara:strand:+ start:686 stop:1195 length:510 start_codon:yes stop_codon:yes gene_type:complete
MAKKNLVLLGMMAAGKTTLGKIVAKILKFEFIDTDKKIEKNNLMTISEIFKKKGEKFFRSEEEKEVLKSLKKNKCVIALGGGAFLNKNLRKNISKNAISVWLDVDINTLNKRVKWNQKRPLLNKENSTKKMLNLYNERKNIYQLADYRIECNNHSKTSLAEKIISLYEK